MRSEIRLAGSGGQGLILGMHILFRAMSLEGRAAAQSQSYEPTSRGGFCFSDVVASDDPSDYPLSTGLDMMAALSQIGLDRSLPALKPGGLLVADERLAPHPPKAGYDVHALPLSARAAALGSPRVANIVALAALVSLSGVVSRESLEQAVRLETPKKFADLNLAALGEGYALAQAKAAE